MLRKNFKQIKIEEREDQHTRPTRWTPDSFIKIEYDPHQYPPVRWAPLYPRSETGEMASEPMGYGFASSKWVKVMKKLLAKLLSSYLGQKQFKNFTQRFRKWKHSSTFIFAILMFVHQRLPKQKNRFCDTYRSKIQALEAGAVDENDANLLHDSVGIVLEFFIGEPVVAVEEFYRKYRSEMNYDSYKGRRFVKFLERAIAEDHRMQEVELDFPSAEFYEEQELQRDKEEESVKMALSNSGREGDSSNVDVGQQQGRMLDESRRGKGRGCEQAFLIYRKDDPTKTPLFPISLNFTVKNAFNDLFQT